jgi:hypothetical protein
MSAHGGRRSNQALGSVLEEAEHNLLAAFKKSQKTKHRALAGNARAKNIADFLSARLPSVYGVATNGEIVDYTDRRSGEIDIVIYDRQRNAVVSAEPLWVAAETLLAYIEVKTTLTQTELEKAFEGAKRVDALRPFRRAFSLAGNADASTGDDEQLRCFRTIFAFCTNLGTTDWLEKEWLRVKSAAAKANVSPASMDRILVLNRGMLNPPSQSGTDQFLVSSVFQQWVINLVNFLTRENGRRPPWDWQMYANKRIPGWRPL